MLGWRPTLRFFELRTTLLRELEKDDNLAAFRWTEGAVGVRLGQGEVLEVGPQGALLTLAGPAARRDVATSALDRLIALLRPEGVIMNQLLVQELLPVEIRYGEARRLSAVRLLRDLMPGIVYSDWSVLLDGASSAVGSTFQVEFGIVDDDEAPARLARHVGKMQDRSLVPLPEDMWYYEEIPACGLFADWRWMPQRAVGQDDCTRELVSLWESLVVEGARCTLNLLERLAGMGANLEGGVV